jgi:hypothetical protein
MTLQDRAIKMVDKLLSGEIDAEIFKRGIDILSRERQEKKKGERDPTYL